MGQSSDSVLRVLQQRRSEQTVPIHVPRVLHARLAQLADPDGVANGRQRLRGIGVLVAMILDEWLSERGG